MTDQAVLGEELLRRGHRVRVLTTDLFHPGRRYPNGQLREQYCGMAIERLRTQASYHWDAVGTGARRMVARTLGSGTILHVFGVRHYLEHVAIRMARRLRVHTFIMPQGSIPAKERHVAEKKVFDALLERKALAFADGVIATSEPEYQALVAWGLPPTHIYQLPEFGERLPPPQLPREHVRRALGVPEAATLLVWSGRIHRVKGMDLLLDVLARDDVLKDVFVVVMGDDEGDGEAARWSARAIQLGLRHRILFQGWCDAQARSNLYSAADAFVLPSISESFSRSAAEALILGCPLIASDTCGIVNHAAEASLIFRRTADELGNAIRTWTTSRELRERLTEGTTTVAARLNPERAAEFLERLYMDPARHQVGRLLTLKRKKKRAAPDTVKPAKRMPKR
ncbi:MAG: glycosyltransferase [Actinomycetota bacterium]